ncbi:site-specific DNA-methyltransferase [Moraxella cuniculi]|uniref:site-specific DNA-methyltransferase n=1 Tax=Moraxella cuniculi TaxID=34061 RepID=UPI0028801D35|nr:site-specific DNA-methyltransferase [Moraxella cuniculi]
MDFDTTQNIFIESDNLEALKILQKSYAGKIKMIYIDPPYNTGNDFIYHDDFSQTQKDYEIAIGDRDINGQLLKSFKKNSKDNGHYHSNWLNMMLPRLHLAHTLLSDDGVIFISIDDNEQAQLKLLCDEIFGEENFISNISLKMKNVAGASGGGEDKKLKKNIEHLLIYTKNYQELTPFNPVFELIEIGNLVQMYKLENKSWKYTSVIVNYGEKKYIKSTTDGAGDEIKIFLRSGYKILSVTELAKLENISEVEVYKKYARNIFQTAMPQSSIRPRVMEALNGMVFDTDLFSIEYIPKSGRNKGVVYEQFYKGEKFRLFSWLSDVSEDIDGKLYKKEMQGTFWDLTSQMNNLSKEGEISFENGKKPIFLIKRLIEMMGDKNDLILDFFAGSATTAHAVMQLNAEDNGNRQFIMVQLPELTDEKSEAYKAGFKAISDISKERIRRAGAKIKAENPNKTLDTGFKVFKLTGSNFKAWQIDDDNAIAEQLEMYINPLKDNAKEIDIVYELLLKMGLKLTATIEFKDGVYWLTCENKSYAIVLNSLSQDGFNTIIAKKPAKTVVLDKAFLNDSEKSNVILQFKDANLNFESI